MLRIETQLAKASLTRVEMRDPYKIYHRETLDSLRKMAPAFAWDRYFEATHLAPTPWLNVAEPAFVTELNARLQKETLDDLKTYLRWTLLAATAPYLSKAFVDEDFAFNRAYLRGVKEQRPRWKKCVDLVDTQLGEALGQEFVARVFPPSMKSQTVLMTHQIEAAMKARIEAARLDVTGHQGAGARQARGGARQGRAIPMCGGTTRRCASSAATFSVMRFAARNSNGAARRPRSADLWIAPSGS